jgi:hypothetical protein
MYSESGTGECPWFENSQAFLPPGLRQLHISNVSKPYLDTLCGLFILDDDDPASEASVEIMDHAIAEISCRAASFPLLQKVCVSAKMDSWQDELSRRTFAVLKYIVEGLTKRKISFEIWRGTVYHWQKRCLLRPGFVRKQPHFAVEDWDIYGVTWSPNDQGEYEKMFPETDELIGNEEMVEGSDRDSDSDEADE